MPTLAWTDTERMLVGVVRSDSRTHARPALPVVVQPLLIGQDAGVPELPIPCGTPTTVVVGTDCTAGVPVLPSTGAGSQRCRRPAPARPPECPRSPGTGAARGAGAGVAGFPALPAGAGCPRLPEVPSVIRVPELLRLPGAAVVPSAIGVPELPVAAGAAVPGVVAAGALCAGAVQLLPEPPVATGAGGAGPDQQIVSARVVDDRVRRSAGDVEVDLARGRIALGERSG